MALFSGQRDVSLLRHINRELMGNIISQQASIYKVSLEKTEINSYGETKGKSYYNGPFLFNCLISRNSQEYFNEDSIVDIDWDTEFRFLKDDLVDSQIKLEVGDIIFYLNNYYEVTSVNLNQFFGGLDPNYPNEPNPITPGLHKFGWNLSIVCKAVLLPQDKVGLTPPFGILQQRFSSEVINAVLLNDETPILLNNNNPLLLNPINE